MNDRFFLFFGLGCITLSSGIIIFNIMMTYAISIPLLLSHAFALLSIGCGIYLVVTSRKEEGVTPDIE